MKMGGYINWYQYKGRKGYKSGTTKAAHLHVSCVYVTSYNRIMQMYRTYKTTNETVIGEENENGDLTLKLIIDVDGKEYVMVKKQEENAIYDLSLIGYVTEIVQDVSFKDFRDVTYARLNKIR